MERVIVQVQLDDAHKNYLEADSNQPHTYRVNRGADEFLRRTLIQFNPFEYLQEQFDNSSEPRTLRVLEAGCGYGLLLRDLKKGIRTKNLVELGTLDPYDLVTWKKKRENTPLVGFSGTLETTGATLNPKHADAAETMIDEAYRPDRIIIGPIENHDFAEEQFDLIIDFLGSGFYFPEAVLPVYGKVLDPKGICYIKLLIGTDSRLAATRSLIFDSRLRIIQEGGSVSGHMDFLLKK